MRNIFPGPGAKPPLVPAFCQTSLDQKDYRVNRDAPNILIPEK